MSSSKSVPVSTRAPFLSIIVVNFQTYELTAQTIKSVLAEIKRSPEELGEGQLEIILVDNASQDDSGERLKQEFSDTAEVTFVLLEKNLGFSGGNEQGFKKARGQVIWLLNSDTIVLPGSLLNLMQMLRRGHDLERNYGVLGCQLREIQPEVDWESSENPENSKNLESSDKKLSLVDLDKLDNLPQKYSQIQPQGGDLPDLGTVFTQMTFLDDLPLIGKYLPSAQHTGRRSRATASPSTFTPTGWVGGTAMIIRREIIDKVGFLDSQIFMYGEDIEFCDRLFHQTRLEAAIYNLAPIVHYGSASSSSRQAILGEFRSYLYIWQKHKSTSQLPWLKLILRLGCILRIFLYSTFRRDPEKKITYQQALKLLKNRLK